MVFSAFLAILIVILSGICAGILIPCIASGFAKFIDDISIRARVRRVGEEKQDSALVEGGRQSSTFRGKADSCSGKSKNSLGDIFSSIIEVLLGGGVPALSLISKKLLKNSHVKRYVRLLNEALTFKEILSKEEPLLQTLILMAGISLVLFSILFGSILFGLICVFLLFVLLRLKARSYLNAQHELIESLIPDALRALGVCYESGLTLMQSFEQVAKDMPQPLGAAFSKVSSDMRSGVSAKQALSSLGESGVSRYLPFLSVTLEIQQKTGGKLQPLLEKMALSVQENFELKRSLDIKTSQSRLSARIVSVMPICVFLLLGLISPSHIVGFVSSPAGLMLFISAIVLELLGIWMIRRILSIEVE